MSSEDVLFEERGPLGLITLNRPKALNALNAGMCQAIRGKLQDWADNDAIQAVVVTGSGKKAFCAGGDVISLYKSGMAYRGGDKDSTEWRDFFWHEYRMNRAIFHFEKPYISILDGITMGGGVGVSVHGSHCVATERTVLAMPETGLGLYPDVGGSYFMPRLPGKTGLYLALTGERMKASDTQELGITQAYIPSERVEMLIALLGRAGKLTHDAVDKILATLTEKTQVSKIGPNRDLIDEFFAKDGVEDIIAALYEDGGQWTNSQAETLDAKSPTSLLVTYEQMQRGADMDFDDVMKMEYRISNHILQGHDFYEGVRAILIDKNNNPQWDPDLIDQIPEKDIKAHFGPLDEELHFKDD